MSFLIKYIKLNRFNYEFRHYSTTTNSKVPLRDVNFYKDLLELKYESARQFLYGNIQLLNADKDELIKSKYVLKSFKFTIEEIRKSSKLLLMNITALQNRYRILYECGFENVTSENLDTYLRIMNKRIDLLKSYHYIPSELDPIKFLQNQLIESCPFEIDTTNIDVNLPLKEIRRLIISSYFMKKLNLTSGEVSSFFKSYPQIRHKSIKSILHTIHLLVNDLKFNDDKIKRNLFVLHADPHNIENMLKYANPLVGLDIKDIVAERPKILTANYLSLLEIQRHLHSFNISNNSIWCCLDIFTLSPDTVFSRLQDLKKIKEFNVLVQHPRILRLVLYQNKAKIRLEYLKRLKIKCFTLNLLSTNEPHFVKFAREGSEKTYGHDVTAYLSLCFKKEDIKIRKYLLRHPNWYFVPLLSVKQALDYLKSEKFTLNEIYQNIYVLLYPLSKITATLKLIDITSLKAMDSSINANTITNSKRLALCLYFMESEYHFTGDGMWIETNSSSQNEIFSTSALELPKTSSDHFRYGRQKITNDTQHV